jgi:ribonuclease HI
VVELVALPEAIQVEVPREVLAEASPHIEGLPPPKVRTAQSWQKRAQKSISPVEPVGARLASYWQAWDQLGASDWVVSVLRWGYSLEFDRDPPLSVVPTIDSRRQNPVKNSIIWQEISTMLEKRALEEVLDPSTPGFYSLLFVVPKKGGKWRPIIDLSILNTFLVRKTFKMETVKSICSLLHKGAWTFSIDLTDAYFHIPIHPTSRKFLRICYGGRVFQFRALPFGISIAPWLFTKVLSSIKLGTDPRVLALFQYIDDWLGECMRKRVCSNQIKVLLNLCQTLGLQVNLEKSDLVPTQQFSFIGIYFDLVLGTIRPTKENIQKLIEAVTLFLTLTLWSAQQWQSLIGILGAQDRFVPWGRYRLRPIQVYFLSQWRPSVGNQSDMVLLPQHLRPHLQWWTNPQNLLQGVPLEAPQFQFKLFTDASTVGWGAHLDNQVVQGVWSEEEKTLHINRLEMRAIRLALISFKIPLGAKILVATDNSTVVCYVNREGGTRSPSLWQETIPLLDLAIMSKWTLRARHIPGRLNVVADQLSRAGQVIPTEWSLHPQVVEWVFQQLWKPMVDLFATRFNNKLPIFVSPVPDPEALETDAISMSWEGLDAYAYPPHQILNKVLEKFRLTEMCSIILIAPYWENQSWFPELLRLSKTAPLPLPVRKNLLKQPRTNVFHSDPGFLRLNAWQLLKKL